MDTVLMILGGYLVGHLVGAWLRERRLRRELVKWGGGHFADRFFTERNEEDENDG